MSSEKYPPYIKLLLVAVLGTAFYCLHFYQYFDQFSSSIFFFNDPDDAKVYSWNTWHFAHQIKRGANPFYTDYIFNPTGASLWMHAYTIWFGMLNLLFNNVALSINLGIAIQLVAAFIGFYLLARFFNIQYLLAISAAYVAVFSTYILAKVGVHYNLALIGILPFILLSFLRLVSHDGAFCINKKYMLPTGGLLLLGFFMDYYIVFYALAFILVYLLWFGALNEWFCGWNWKKTLILVGTLVVGHIGVRLLRISGFSEKGALWAAADIRGLVNQGLNSRFFQEKMYWELTHSVNDNKIFLGYSFIGIFILCVVLYLQIKDKDKWTRFFLFATLLFGMVTLPVIRIAGTDLWYNITAIVHFIPFVNNVRSPDRFILLVFVFGAMFMARVVTLQWMNKNIKLDFTVFLLVPVTLFFLEHAQQDMEPIELPVSKKSVLAEMQNKTVLMLPFGIRDGYQQFGEFDENQLLLQQEYGFKMPSGYLSRVGKETWEYYKANDLFSSLVLLQNGERVNGFNWHSTMVKWGIEQVYMPKSSLSEFTAVAEMMEKLPATKKEDENGVLFSLYK